MSYLKEDSGKNSASRVVFIVGMLWSMLVSTVLTITMDWEAGEFIAVFTATSAVFVGLKLGQKPLESKKK
jgi:hypothetical protein